MHFHVSWWEGSLTQIDRDPLKPRQPRRARTGLGGERQTGDRLEETTGLSEAKKASVAID